MRGKIFGGAIAGFMLLGTVSMASAQGSQQIRKNSLSDIEFYTTNYGIFGLDIVGARSGFTVPRGSTTSYIFGAGLWFGARKKVGSDTNALCFVAYDPNTASGWGTAEAAGNPAGKTESLYYSGGYDHTTGASILPSDPNPWPLWLESSQISRPGAAGWFEPDWTQRKAIGTYAAPAFVPGVSEQFVSRYNDGNLAQYGALSLNDAQRLGYPLGLRFTQNIYAWASGPYKDAVMLEYEIVNTSADTLFNCAVAQVTDVDLGNPQNDIADYFTRRPDLRAGYAWTQPEAKGTYGVLATAIIEGPVTDANGYIDNNQRHSYYRDGRVGAFRVGTIEEDPTTPEQRYTYLTSGVFGGDLVPRDRRLTMGTMKFNMRPRDTVHFTIMYGVVANAPGSTAGSELETLLESMNDDYYNRQFVLGVPFAPASAAAPLVAITPNPVGDRAVLRFSSRARSNATLRLANSIGEIVMERPLGMVEPGDHDMALDVSALPPGVYVAVIDIGSESAVVKLVVAR